MKHNYFICYITSLIIILNYGCNRLNTSDKDGDNEAISDTIKKKFTGEKKHYWENGNLKASIQYVDGLRQGINKNYSKTGKLLSVVPFSQGMINGESIQYYPNGKIHSKINYVNDVKHGSELWFYENTQLYQKCNYYYGKLEGMQYKFYKNGVKMSEAPYKNGQPGIGLKEYNKDGTLKKMPEIIVTETNNIKLNGEYIVTYKLSDNSIAVKFYAGELTNGKYFSPHLSPILTTNGKGKTVLRVNKSSFIMHTLNVIAKKKTYFRNEYVIQKKVNIAVENR